MPLEAAGFGFLWASTLSGIISGALRGHLQVVIWLTGGGAARLPTAVSRPFRRPLGSSSPGGCCHPSGWGISSASQSVDDGGQTQCCSRETVDRLGRLSADAILAASWDRRKCTAGNHYVGARLQPWSHGFHWTLQKLAEEAISLHDGVILQQHYSCCDGGQPDVDEEVQTKSIPRFASSYEKQQTNMAYTYGQAPRRLHIHIYRAA
ncbi:uncharacterized protein TRIREDRAFT_112508 [Trichoderma reesei QM6a]|uniref:Predicted protein n=2 Tax=Hypocrea jecorina TaxID=51453 RepID=G0RX86_HYPJQ|nr:uncharacterized protein TRIREDRAFT_112508 [Trichoderma reesei QM6a]EGR44204.1 predicted protein [Trichoderma reesei QM6a]ETR96840.1 hypothetical protein M419DRAFT_135045 [Trichoderma reesei RUT C-30]